jgi:hypothetical protein
MVKIGRNDPCPCGSGKKFKKCHYGREDEIFSEESPDFPIALSKRITGLAVSRHRRAAEMLSALDIRELTGSRVGVRFIDLKDYRALSFPGAQEWQEAGGDKGGLVINTRKTAPADPDHIYIAISADATDGTIIHLLAHVLDDLGGSRLTPGLARPLSFELEVPLEHLEHPLEFGRWLEYLRKKFDVPLDADDTIIAYLYDHGRLIKGEDIRGMDRLALKAHSDDMLKFLSERSREIDELIRERDGYVGSRVTKD